MKRKYGATFLRKLDRKNSIKSDWRVGMENTAIIPESG